jgi:hypothetical protein
MDSGYHMLQEYITYTNFCRMLYKMDPTNTQMIEIKPFDYKGNFLQSHNNCECWANYNFIKFGGSLAIENPEITPEIIAIFKEMRHYRQSNDPNPALFPEQYYENCLDELHKIKAVMRYTDYLEKIQSLLDFSIIESLPIRIMEILLSEGAILFQTHIQYIVQKSVNKEYRIIPRDMSIAEFLISKGLKYNNLTKVDREYFGLPVTAGKKTISVMDYIKQCGHIYARIYYGMLLRA